MIVLFQYIMYCFYLIWVITVYDGDRFMNHFNLLISSQELRQVFTNKFKFMIEPDEQHM